MMPSGSWCGKVLSGKALAALALPLLCGASTLSAQRAPVGPSTRSYVRVDTSVVALTNVRVIDGTGAAARDAQTVIIRDGRI
ncbi:MAG TPA: hypothetical protein VGE27_17430, partial [Gemmatimonas sp.]